MLAVEKAHHINTEFSGEGAGYIASILRREIPSIQIFGDLEDEELEDVAETEWYKKLKATITRGDRLRTRRENACLSQKKLAEKTGFSVRRISEMENDRRPIDEETARTLAGAIDCELWQILGD